MHIHRGCGGGTDTDRQARLSTIVIVFEAEANGHKMCTHSESIY